MKKWLWAAAAFLIAIGFSILGRDERKARRAENQRDGLLLIGSGNAKHKAHLAGIKADKHQANAKKAAEVGQAAIDKVGSQNESVRNILDSWRSDRVQ